LQFVADSTPKELRRLVEFLNEEMSRVEVLAGQGKQFQMSAAYDVILDEMEKLRKACAQQNERVLPAAGIAVAMVSGRRRVPSGLRTAAALFPPAERKRGLTRIHQGSQYIPMNTSFHGKERVPWR